ncbi:hypothetical protein D915_007407 [Fasciola hepatica]|uniref:CDT1 Geminin-binding domain-containing protein n=1 Tax=Fasciola hepatica TaxID=6192 RepID=A0A4E0R6N2_FASHE|nr:hypothetical protein D915_007407 [Fasciola hepatica]
MHTTKTSSGGTSSFTPCFLHILQPDCTTVVFVDFPPKVYFLAHKVVLSYVLFYCPFCLSMTASYSTIRLFTFPFRLTAVLIEPMSRDQIANYFPVSRAARNVPKQKRLIEDIYTEPPAPKRPAHTRFSHLVEEANAPSSQNEANITRNPKPTVASTLSSADTKRNTVKQPTRPRGRKVINLSKQSTITWSPVSHEPSANAVSESKADGVTKSTIFTADEVKVNDAKSRITPTLIGSTHLTQHASQRTRNQVYRKSPSACPRSKRNVSHSDGRQIISEIDKSPLDSTVLLPSTFETVPACTRFAHLAEAPVPAVTDERAESVVHKLVTPVSTDTELTQTEEKIPTGLPLPSNFRALLEMFRSCDTVVSMLHNRKELCSFDKLKPAVQEVVRRNFEESHVAQFMTVYPMVYHLRYEKHLDKYTRRPTGAYVLALSPNLRTDGTQSGHDSPSKGHLVFTGTRLIQRRNRFHRLLLGIVMHAHRVRARENERRFLTELTKSNIPESRRAVYAHLPSFIPQVWTVMRTGNGRPLPLAVVAGRIAGGYHGGLSVDTIMEHLNILIELCPSWLQKLDWTTPHLKVCAPKSSVKEILDNVKDTLLKEGYQL